MKHKSSWICLLAILFFCQAELGYGQRLTKRDFTFTYKSVPLQPLPSNMKYYHIQYDGTTLMHQNMDFSEEFVKGINLKTYEKVNDPYSEKHSPDFMIFIKSLAPLLEPMTLASTKIDDIPHYYFRCLFNVPHEVTLLNKNGEIIGKPIIVGTGNSLASGKFFKTIDKATKWKEEEGSGFLQSKIKETNGQNINEINKIINKMYGYPMITKKLFLYSVNDSEDRYGNINNATNHGIDLFKTIGENKHMAYKNSHYIDYAHTITGHWEKALQDKDLNNKKALINKKIAEGLYYNLCITKMYLNEFNEVEILLKEAGKIKKGGWVKTLRKENENRRQQIENYLAASSHP